MKPGAASAEPSIGRSGDRVTAVDSPLSMRSRFLFTLGPAVLLALLVAGYSSSRHGAFQFDDVPAIADNLVIKDLPAFLETLWSRTGALGRPLSELTFAVDYWRAGLDPVAFHTTSLAVHLLAVLLAFLFIRETLRRGGRERPGGLALAATGLWALHPLLSQAVSYIVQRSEALASALYLAALLLLLAAHRRGRTAAGAALYAAGAVAFLFGLQAKLVVITLPAALLLHLALFETEPAEASPRRRWLGRAAAAAPLFLLSALFATAALSGLRGHGDAGFDVRQPAPWSYLLGQPRAVLRYLRLVLWPSGQNLDYDSAPSLSPIDPPETLAAWIGLALLLAAGARFLLLSRRPRRDPDLARAERVSAFGVAWFLLLLSPTSSVVPLADLVVEHRAYLASLGIVLALAAWGELLLRRLVPGRRRGLAAAGSTLVLWTTLAAVLHARNEVWASPIALWTDVRDKAPRKARAHYNLGDALSEAGDDQAAIGEYLTASMLMGRDTVDWYRLLRNLGASMLAVGRADDAIAVLSQALRDDPWSPEIHNNLALAFLQKGALDPAEEQARLAIRDAPSYPQSYNTLGEIRSRRGDLAGALAAFLRAAHLAPDGLTPLYNTALMEEALGRRAEACATWAQYGIVRGGEGRATAEERRRLLGCDSAPGPGAAAR